MTIINCTPHPVIVILDDGTTREFAPSGVIPRVSSIEEEMPSIMGIPTCRRIYGAVQFLPDPEEDTFFIVSSMVKAAVPNREDLLVPHDFVRDEAGNILGCRKFAQ